MRDWIAGSPGTPSLLRLLLGSTALITALAAGGASPLAVGAVPESTDFYPAFAPAPPAQTSPGNRSQTGETWVGTAYAAPRRRARSASVHGFDAGAGFDNASLTAAIAWDPRRALGDGLDLYVDRLARPGSWVEVGSAADGGLLDDGEQTRTVTVSIPAPGTYRTRVVNLGQRTLTYHGSIGFSVVERAAGASAERATHDRPDAVSGAQLHVLYVVPAQGVDEALDTNGVIESSVAALNAWFERESGRHLRLDTYADGDGNMRLDVSFVQGAETAEGYASGVGETGPFGVFVAITGELEDRGWSAKPGSKRYLVYYAGAADNANVCGTAYVPRRTDFAQWSVVFLGATPGCGSRDFGTPATGGGMAETIATQELEHNEGMAPLEARHQCWALRYHICAAAAAGFPTRQDAEALDVMFPFVVAALREKHLDAGHDDYFEHPFAYRDLADSPFWERG